MNGREESEQRVLMVVVVVESMEDTEHDRRRRIGNMQCVVSPDRHIHLRAGWIY